MNNRRLSRIWLLSIACVFGVQSSSSYGSYMSNGSFERENQFVSLKKPADVLLFRLTAACDDDDDDKSRIQRILQTRADFESMAKTWPGATIRTSNLAMFVQTGSKWSVGKQSQLQMVLTVPLQPKSSALQIFDLQQKVFKEFRKYRPPEDVEVEVFPGTISLANPEQYRAELLQLIRAKVDRLGSMVKAKGNVRLRGLESELLLKQIDESTLELYIPFSADFGL